MSVRSRRSVVAVAAALALVAVSRASGVEIDGYTATGTPAHVKPSTQTSFTVTLTNKPTSPREADKAKIGIPGGFTVAAASVQASASAAGACLASLWVEDGTLIANGKINLKRAAGGPRLCPGATLTVQFLATSSAAEGTYVWATELLRDTDTFVLTGPQPSVEVDGTAPTVTIASQPSNPSNDSSPTFAFSAGEPASFQCELDGAGFNLCTSPKSYDNLSQGQHTFKVRATDLAANAGPAATYTWTVDTVAPTVAIVDKPDNPSGVKSATFTFSADELARFQCELDGAGFNLCTSPTSYDNLSQGDHTFRVRAIDLAGNVGLTATYVWLVETVRPVVTLTETPAASTSSAAATFSFEAQNKPASSYQCNLDGAPFEVCTSPKAYGGLADGRHTFRVKGTGTAGTGPETVYTWTIDTRGPSTAITGKPADPTNGRSASFAFAASEPATFQCKLDGGAFAACSPPQAYGNLGDGRHTFVVRAIDALSNVGPETAYGWTIETRAPVATITSAPRGLGNSTIAALSFSADEPATFQCKLDDGAFEACSSPASYAGLRDGGHAFVVRAIDSAGNAGVASHGWTVDATAPQTTINSAPARSTTATSARFAFSSSEPATFQCRLDRGAFAPCGAPRTYKTLARGLHTFAVRAIDSAGNIDATPAVSTWRVGRRITRTVAKYALFTPALGARVNRPPLLRWRAVGRAKYYNVQLYRGSRKVLTAWPTRSRLQLRMRWTYDGRVERFKAGVYRWYVWPGFGRAADRRYGRLLGTSTFTVGRATPTR